MKNLAPWRHHPVTGTRYAAAELTPRAKRRRRGRKRGFIFPIRAPQSHGVGPCSEGWLTWRKSALQSTWSTTGCPALGRCPKKRDWTLTLRAASGDESNLWGRHCHPGGQARWRSFLSVVSEYSGPGDAVASGLVASQPDWASVPHHQASAGDRSLSGAKRRRLLRALGSAFDGELSPVLYEPSDLQGSGNDGRDRIPFETSLVQCNLWTPWAIWGFMRHHAETRVNTRQKQGTENSGLSADKHSIYPLIGDQRTMGLINGYGPLRKSFSKNYKELQKVSKAITIYGLN